MKIKKAKDSWKVYRANEDDKTVWYLAEKTKRQPDGTLLCTGKIIDVTEAIEPYINHCNSEVNMLTSIIGRLINETFELRGITPTEHDKITKWNELKEKEQ